MRSAQKNFRKNCLMTLRFGKTLQLSRLASMTCSRPVCGNGLYRVTGPVAGTRDFPERSLADHLAERDDYITRRPPGDHSAGSYLRGGIGSVRSGQIARIAPTRD